MAGVATGLFGMSHKRRPAALQQHDHIEQGRAQNGPGGTQVSTAKSSADGVIISSGAGTAERRNCSALAWRNTKTIDIFNFEDGAMHALQRRIF